MGLDKMPKCDPGHSNENYLAVLSYGINLILKQVLFTHQ